MKFAGSFTRAFLAGSILSLLCFLPLARAAAIPAQVSGIDVVHQKKVTVPLTSASTGSHFTVVVFLSAKCPCSDSHTGELKALAKEFSTPQTSVSFIGIHSNFDENAEVTKAYFTKTDFPFPVIQDVKAQYADQFQALKTPHAFVINEKGDVLYKGGVSDSHEFAKSKHQYLREALNDLKAGKSVATKEGRTLGCVITRENGNAW